MILIVGRRDDPHVAGVIAALERQAERYVVLDAFAKSSDGISHCIGGSTSLAIGAARVALADITAVWWRQKPGFIVPTHSATALYDYFFVQREWNHLIDFLGAETRHLFSINNRDAMAVANNKLTQLKTAVECGFAVPDTLVSNDAEAILEFSEKHHRRKIVYKPFTPYMPPTGTITYTTQIDAVTLRANQGGLSIAPGLFQAFVAKDFELRVTVVGSELFAARINSHFSEETAVDWRRDIFADIYTDYELDDTFRSRLLHLHRRFGLFFAAYDFIIDPDGRRVLLDVNPAGQWMWLESRLGFPIAHRLAVALVRSSSRELVTVAP